MRLELGNRIQIKSVPHCPSLCDPAAMKVVCWIIGKTGIITEIPSDHNGITFYKVLFENDDDYTFPV